MLDKLVIDDYYIFEARSKVMKFFFETAFEEKV